MGLIYISVYFLETYAALFYKRIIKIYKYNFFFRELNNKLIYYVKYKSNLGAVILVKYSFLSYFFILYRFSYWAIMSPDVK